MTTLPQDSAARKMFPLHAGLFRYFPSALAGVAKHSLAGNQKHNPGASKLIHSRDISSDHADCLLRHLMDLTELLEEMADMPRIKEEANSLAWRALAISQLTHEACGAPVAPAAVFGTPVEEV